MAERVAAQLQRPRTDNAGTFDATHVAANLDQLAQAGLFGLFGPREAGGMEATLGEGLHVVETLAKACMQTTFVWMQHHGAVGAVASSENSANETLLADLCGGRARGGVVFAGLKPGPSSLQATDEGQGGVIINGQADWFTGYGLIDVALVAARQNESVVTALLDIETDPGITFLPRNLLAMEATGTGALAFADVSAAADRVVSVEPHVGWGDGSGLWLNGALRLGFMARCVDELGDSARWPHVELLRERLHQADGDNISEVRAAICAGALNLAARTMVGAGSGGILADSPAATLFGQAGFLLTFGQRPGIKRSLLAELPPHVSGRR